MKTDNIKEQQRRRLKQDMEHYLARGGQIKKVPNGASGDQPDDAQRRRSFPFSHSPPTPRTDLSKVAAMIDARKRNTSRPAKKRRPRRRLIYDDFGEPLRWVWDE